MVICTWVICGLGVATGMICMCHCGWAWPLDDMYVSLWFGCGHWDDMYVSLWFGCGHWDIRIDCRYGLGMVII